MRRGVHVFLAQERRERSRRRVNEQDEKEQVAKETAAKEGTGIQEGEPRMALVTAAEECKNEMAYRIARHARTEAV